MPLAMWMRRVALAALLLCFGVVVLGAYVRLTAAGLGCPDWPGCYGHLSPVGAARSADLAQAFPDRPLEVGKAWREMIHRYAVGTLACLIFLLALLAVRTRQQRLASVALAAALVATLLVQAVLGALTVTWRLNPLIVTAHLVFGMTTLALLWWLTLSLPTGSWGAAAPAGGGGAAMERARRLALIGLAALIVQIVLGGWTSSNYAAVACPDFPTCQGALWPPADFAHAFEPWHGQINYEGGVLENAARVAIHLTHRLGALIATTALALAAVFVLRRRGLTAARLPAWAVLGALALQLLIGVSMVLRSFPLPLATAHTAGAALLLLATLALVRALSPRQRPAG
ncbi:MAG: COX15/CtaA family protein [Proteobacteria bacterium]|nr:COX15/CtaA family protein [Pseudomonadota bacterium]